MNFPFVHETTIDESGMIGKGTKIWHFSHISRGAVVGKNCIIGQNVFIGEDVIIGDGCKLQNNVFLPKGVELEDDVFVGPGTTFTNIKNPRAFIERKKEFRNTVVCKGASIGANCTILCGIMIGSYAIIGAGSVVVQSINAFGVAFGNPAEAVGVISMDGTKIDYY